MNNGYCVQFDNHGVPLMTTAVPACKTSSYNDDAGDDDIFDIVALMVVTMMPSIRPKRRSQ